MFSGPIDVSRFGLMYSGAQKNLGPSGVTLVIVREDLLARSSDTLPVMLNYKVHAENNSLYNTPNTFGIYILGLTVKWLRSLGGLPAIAAINQRQAGKIYTEIDRTGFYRGTARKDSRSLMNVTFRLAIEELEKMFVKESTAAGLDGPEGAPLGGWHAGVDLQRVPRRRGRRAGRFYARVRTHARVRQATSCGVPAAHACAVGCQAQRHGVSCPCLRVSAPRDQTGGDAVCGGVVSAAAILLPQSPSRTCPRPRRSYASVPALPAPARESPARSALPGRARDASVRAARAARDSYPPAGAADPESGQLARHRGEPAGSTPSDGTGSFRSSPC